ncbi:MAG TPA: methyltransferase domain-containing protein [Gemmatimonadaceae bacterium]|nr:methyltransferase domain-containing protein [Gemmatimonadaceae bacterium]
MRAGWDVAAGQRRRVSLGGISTRNKGVFALGPHHAVTRWIEALLVCPACHGDVARSADFYRCASCAAAYPIRHGVPDFRLWPDEYVSVADELAKIDRLFAPPAPTFRQLLTRYYDLSPESPRKLNVRYVAAIENSATRDEALLRKLRNAFPDVGRTRFLDLGCGTAALALAASKEFAEVVAVDAALRWLLVARQRLNEAGAPAVGVALICANAEALPFRLATFDAVMADSVLEHVRDSTRMQSETMRVLRGGGAFLFTTNNRFSILPEPHVRILGFGLIPRRWMERMALALRKTPYKARLHSRRELRRLFRDTGRVELPVYEPGELGERNERARRIWEMMRHIPLLRWMMGPIVPQYFISGRKS